MHGGHCTAGALAHVVVVVRWSYGCVVVVAQRHCHRAIVVMQWFWACVVIVTQGKVRALSAQWTCTLSITLCACGSRRAGALCVRW